MMNWRTRAACLHDDPELFFPDHAAGPVIDLAKQICAGCLVRARCLDWALSNNATSGIWGGRTEAERRAMRPTSRWPVRQA
jgi:WhiB family transcriptional regulator, redox-sensing transcriptional regulator